MRLRANAYFLFIHKLEFVYKVRLLRCCSKSKFSFW